MVALFDPHARGKHAGQQVHPVTGAQFAAHRGDGLLQLGDLRFDTLDVAGQGGVNHLRIGQVGVGIRDG